MVKGYNIELIDLKNKLDYLKVVNDGSKLITTDIIVLEALINRLESNFEKSYRENDDVWEDVGDDYLSLNKHSELIRIIHKLRIKPKHNRLFRFTATYSPLLLSDREAVDLAYDFYGTKANVFYNSFLDVYDYLDNHLKFITPNPYTEGEMVQIHSTRESFIYVPNNPNFTKVTTLIHEIQHAIDALENKDFLDNIMIKESAAVFMELIASDYLSKILGIPNDGLNRRANIHSIVINDALYLQDKFEMFKSLNGTSIDGIESFYKALYARNYEDSEIDYNLRYRADTLVMYQLPQLLAIELYYIYKKSPQDALELLQGITWYCNDDNILKVLPGAGIHLGKHYHKYQRELEKGLHLKRR